MDNEILTKIGEKAEWIGALQQTGQVQADWNQNDEAAKDYIKNRPFYSYARKITCADSDYTTEDLSSQGFTGVILTDVNLGEFDLAEETAELTIGEITYSTKDIKYFEAADNLPYLGNLSIAIPFFQLQGISADIIATIEDTGESFCFIGWDTLFTQEVATLHIKATRNIIEYVRLDWNDIDNYFANVPNISSGTGADSITTMIDYPSHASGDHSFSANYYNNAKGKGSAAFGWVTEAIGDSSHTEGTQVIASGDSSHAEGRHTLAYGYISHAEGTYTLARGFYSHAEGQGTGDEYTGFICDAGSTIFKRVRSSLPVYCDVGNYVYFSGKIAKIISTDKNALTFTTDTSLSKEAIGSNEKFKFYESGFAIGEAAHSEGYGTKASGNYSHSEGYNTEATGESSHAEGFYTDATGVNSHAEGDTTKATGANSHAEGHFSFAYSENQHVQGKYNIEDADGKYAHIVGNGTDTNVRSNAHTLDWSGNAWFAGTVEGTAMIVKSSTEGSTKKFKITVNDSGAISATEITN